MAWAYSVHFRPSAVTGLKQCAQGLSGFNIRSSGATHGWGKLSFSRVVLGGTQPRGPCVRGFQEHFFHCLLRGLWTA